MGICVYAVDYLFSQINFSQNKEFKIKISYLEIYNEQVIDLLVEDSANLMIVEDSIKGITVPDLTEYNVKSSREVISFILKGNSKRILAETDDNLFSSRSHAILQIIIEQKKISKKNKNEEFILSKFLLVDLAGSERSTLKKGIRSLEGKNINKSLLSLGNCINILSDKSKKGAFIPYRDSKLTRLLKDSLGGNIMSVMIACISPSPTCYDETLNTLNYAMKARKIKKEIYKNTKQTEKNALGYEDVIDSLKGEIEELKKIIRNQQNLIFSNPEVYNNHNKSLENINKRSQIKKKENLIYENKNENELSKEKDYSNFISSSNNMSIVSDNFKKKLKNDFLFRIGDISSSRDNTFQNENNSHNLENIPKIQKESKENIYNKNINSKEESENPNEKKINLQKQKNSEFFDKKFSIINSFLEENISKTFFSPKSNSKIIDYINYFKMIFKTPEEDYNFEDFSKLIERYNIYSKFSLYNEKIFLEEEIKEESTDEIIYDKFKLYKFIYYNFLDLINEKLVENLDQNMILKINLKEVLDLNLMNNENVKQLFIF